MNEHTLLIGHTTVRVYLPENGRYLPLFISFLSPQEGAQLAALLADRAVLAVIDEADWEGCFRLGQRLGYSSRVRISLAVRMLMCSACTARCCLKSKTNAA